MKGKKRALSLLLAALLPGLCACQAGSSLPASEASPEITLPPAVQSYVAPIGDAALEYTADATLYLPRHSGSRLTAVVSPVTFSASRPRAESLVRALLNHSGTSTAAALGGNVKLALYGANPVEVSRNAATVNLAASALQLNRGDLYIAFQAIANTLTELKEIDYVNFLIVDHPVGLDVANTLPMGSFSRSLSEDLSSVYEQRLSRRVGLNESAEDKSLSANVTLYYPLAGTPGLLSEVRSLSFANQKPSDMIVQIMRELSKGASVSEIDSPPLNLLVEMLTGDPEVAYSDELGGSVITLNFSYSLNDMLEKANVSRANCMASLCYTLCSFFPAASGVTVTIGEQPVETLMLTDSFTSSIVFTDQVMKRADFAPLLCDLCTLYFADGEGRGLQASRRPVVYYQKQNPRALLLELSKGPQPYDEVPGLAAVMPVGSLSDADILGLALSGRTVLVNFAPAFLEAGQGMDGQQERLFVYAMTNTLCENQTIGSAAYFVSGAVPESNSGEIYWGGEFYPLK